ARAGGRLRLAQDQRRALSSSFARGPRAEQDEGQAARSPSQEGHAVADASENAPQQPTWVEDDHLPGFAGGAAKGGAGLESAMVCSAGRTGQSRGADSRGRG